MVSKPNRGSSVFVTEPLESRRLLSTTTFGPFPATAEPPAWTVAGEPIGSEPGAGGAEIAALTGGNFLPFQDMPLSQRPAVIINWGDGSRPFKTNSDVDTENNRLTANVSAPDSHTYRRPGTYSIRVQFVYQNHVLGKTIDRVRVLRNSPGSNAPTEIAGTPFSAVLGTFSDTYFAPLGGTTDWGDGQQSPPTVQSLGSQRYQASGSHTYSRPGKYHVKVRVEVGPPPGSGIEAADAIITEIITTISVRAKRRR